MYDRQQVLAQLGATLDQGKPIIGAGAGTGISAKFAERGGADLILIYNSGRYRMNGFGSNAGLLPIGDANAIVVEMGERDVLPVVHDTPVIAGVFGSDPTRVLGLFLDKLPPIGFSGIINFPSHGYIDGEYRASLEETGFGLNNEIELIRKARERDIFSLAYCYDLDSVDGFVGAGVDVLVAHMGLTTGGSIGASRGESKDLTGCIELTNAMTERACSINADVLVLTHGGPLETPQDMATVLHATDTHGFIGASTMERLPVESAIEDTVRDFKRVALKG